MYLNTPADIVLAAKAAAEIHPEAFGIGREAFRNAQASIESCLRSLYLSDAEGIRTDGFFIVRDETGKHEIWFDATLVYRFVMRREMAS
jgi:hypothetical protein